MVRGATTKFRPAERAIVNLASRARSKMVSVAWYDNYMPDFTI